MDENSSRIDDPTYQSNKDIKQTSFFGVFFCSIRGDNDDTI